LPAGAIAWWPGNGNFLDLIGRENGVFYGGSVKEGSGVVADLPDSAGFGAGEVGQCFHFESGWYANVPTSPVFGIGTNDFTVEFWARFDGTSPNMPEILFGNGAWSVQWDGQSIALSLNGAPVNPVPYAPAIGEWTHLAWARLGNTVVFYTNGIVAGSQTTATVASVAPVESFSIGRVAPGFSFIGDLDEITIYRRALGQNELSGIVAAGSSGKCFPALPSVTISPLTNQTPLLAGATVLLAANPAASSPTNPIAKVLFYAGTNLLAVATNSPWIFAWSNVAAGSYAVAVEAVDADGFVTAPETLNVVVRPDYSGVSSYAPPYAISTLAGRAPAAGFADGVGPAALFNGPRQLTRDAAGNLYVADAGNNAIRKIAPDGTTTTLAGGQIGNADGAGTNASFNFPSGVAVDGSGSVYVADQFNFSIREISPGGTVTTFAEPAGLSSDASGLVPSVAFNHPGGLAINLEGNVCVADLFNSVVWAVTPGGAVYLVDGRPGEVGTTDQFGDPLFAYPASLAVDNHDQLYVADTGNSVIKVIATNGAVSTLAGLAMEPGTADGSVTNAQFAFPEGIAVDSAGNAFVADTGNNTVRKIGADGAVTTVAGRAGMVGATDGMGTNALFAAPRGIVVDPAGNIFVADSGNNSIREISPGGQVTTFAGSGGSAGSDNGPGSAARFNYPASVAADGEGNIFVADGLNFLVRKIGPDGTVTDAAGRVGVAGAADGAATNALFASPVGVAVDLAGNVYVADADNSTIRRLDPAGNVTTFAGQTGQAGSSNGPAALALFNTPSGVAVDLASNVYVADTGNQIIRKISGGGQVSTLAGLAGVAGYQDGVGTNALFSSPSSVAVDLAGNVYVADPGNYTVRKIMPDGTVTTVAGDVVFNSGVFGAGDGVGGKAAFSAMAGLAVDKTGNVYVADTFNNTIRMIATNGSVTTIGGVAGTPGSADGSGANALFFHPAGIAVDAAGIVYVADSLNNTIRVGIPSPTSPPELEITGLPGEVTLAWPGSASGFVLQAAESLGTGVTWITITNGISLVGGQFTSTNPATGSAVFYRLRSQ
jgi:sugar lactone lactonase YvrE